MSGLRFVRFYSSDWRSGCIGLTMEQQGFYVAVCAHFWETGTRLPLDDAEAASRLMMDIRMYRRLKAKLIEKGKLHVGEDGLYNPRAEVEYRAARKAAQKGEAVVVGAARGPADGEHQNRRDPVEGRVDSAHTVDGAPETLSEELPGDFSETSGRLLGKLSRKNGTSETPSGGVEETSGELPGDVSENFPEKVNEIKGLFKDYIEEKKERKNTPLTPQGGPTPMDALQAFELYNATALRCGLQQAVKLTKDRQRRLIARLRDYGLDGWKVALACVERSSFLTGSNDRGWRVNLDFLLQASSFSKVHDGVFGNGRHVGEKPRPTYQPSETREQMEARVAREMGYL